MAQSFFVLYKVYVKEGGRLLVDGCTTCSLRDYNPDTFLQELHDYIKHRVFETTI